MPIKESVMFGETIKISAVENHNPDYTRLGQAFESTDSVMYQFCRGCGFTAEIDKEVAHVLFRSTGKPNEDFSIQADSFFEVGGCSACDGNEHDVELKFIPSV